MDVDHVRHGGAGRDQGPASQEDRGGAWSGVPLCSSVHEFPRSPAHMASIDQTAMSLWAPSVGPSISWVRGLTNGIGRRKTVHMSIASSSCRLVGTAVAIIIIS